MNYGEIDWTEGTEIYCRWGGDCPEEGSRRGIACRGGVECVVHNNKLFANMDEMIHNFKYRPEQHFFLSTAEFIPQEEINKLGAAGDKHEDPAIAEYLNKLWDFKVGNPVPTATIPELTGLRQAMSQCLDEAITTDDEKTKREQKQLFDWLSELLIYWTNHFQNGKPQQEE